MSDLAKQEFIQDFLEESAEHLQSVNQNLLALEQSLDSPEHTVEIAAARTGLLKELFRSFHTLKGLSGMVGLQAATQLSHAMESVLRAVQQAEIEITPLLIDSLFRGVRQVEAAVASVRNPEAPSPDISAELAALQELLPPAPSGPSRSPAPTPPAEETYADISPAFLDPILGNYPDAAAGLTAIERGLLWARHTSGQTIAFAIFTPTPDKSAQGENVNLARQQLSQAAELVKSMPLIGGSAVRFAFLVASPGPLDPQDFVQMEWLTLPGISPASGPNEGLPAGSSLPSLDLAQPPASVSIRVDMGRLDELLRLVSDLVVTRYRIQEILPDLTGAPSASVDTLRQTVGDLERNVRDLRQAVVRTRMVPLSEVFSHLPLAVRDLARASGKEIRLVMEGETTEVDKMLVERLLDPLLHMARNAITHGIEPPAERLAAGKPAHGSLALRGVLEGDRILISVSDDGRGIDFDRVAAKAVALGWLDPAYSPGGSKSLGQAEALDLILRPGFSTQSQVDLGAGRGVGMDIVNRMVSAIGGSLSMHSIPGRGVTFSLRLPVTLTILDALIVRCGSERYAIPRIAVDQVIEVDPAQVVRLEGTELLPFQEDSLSVVRLAALFDIPSSPAPHILHGLISVAGEQRTVLVVDRVQSLREVVVRPISDPLVARPSVTGATELGDGSIILILDIASLFQFAKRFRKV